MKPERYLTPLKREDEIWLVMRHKEELLYITIEGKVNDE